MNHWWCTAKKMLNKCEMKNVKLFRKEPRQEYNKEMQITFDSQNYKMKCFYFSISFIRSITLTSSLSYNLLDFILIFDLLNSYH